MPPSNTPDTGMVPLTGLCPVGVGQPCVGGVVVVVAGRVVVGGRLVVVGGRVVVPGGRLVLVVPVTDPVHTVPLSVNWAGTGFELLFQLPLKPTPTLPLVGIEAV